MRHLRGLIAFAVAAAVLWAPGASARCRFHPDLLVRTDGSAIEAVDVRGCGSQVAAWAPSYGADVPLGNGFLTDPSWLPGGRSFVYGWTHGVAFVADATEVRRSSASGGDPTTVLRVPLAGMITEVAASPDGRRIAFTLFTPNYPVILGTWTAVGSPMRIYVVNADGSGLQLVSTVSVTWDFSPVWSPDSRKLAFVSGRGPISVYVTDLHAGPGLLGTRVSPLDVLASAPAWAPDGRHLAFNGSALPNLYGSTDPDIWTVAPDGTGARKVGRGSNPSYAPDGRHLVVGTQEGIAVLDLAHPRSRLLTHRADDHYPVWSPDGRLIAFPRWGTYEVNDGGLWTVGADGRGATRRVDQAYGIPAWRR